MGRDLEIFVDGACSGNPGPAGIGVVVFEDGQIIKEISKTIGEATNNIAEYTALICALKEALDFKADSLKLFTDSELVYKQMTGQYKVKHEGMRPLYQQAQDLSSQINQFKIQHVRREKNKKADALATGSLK